MTRLKKGIDFNVLALSAVFLAADGFVLLPLKKSGGIFEISAAAVLSLAVSLLLSRLYLSENKTLKIISGILVFSVSSFCLLFSLKTVFSFVSVAVLPEAGFYKIVLPFLILIIFFATRNKTAVIKSATVVFVLFAVLLAVLIAVSTGEILRSGKELPVFIFEKSFSFKGAKDNFLKIFLPFCAFVPLCKKTYTKDGKSIFSGFIIALIFLCACLFCSVLLLSESFSASADFPFLLALGTVSVGKLYTRLDGILYMLFFLSSAIKDAYLLKGILTSLKTLN